MTSEISIRRVDPTKHRDVLDELQKLCLPHDTPCAYLPNDLWWIAYRNTSPVAFSCVRPSMNYSDTWYLARAGVIPEARGLGLQKRMIRARIAAAKKAGVPFVITDCTVDNTPSANNLIACGFKLFRPPNKWAGAGANYWKLSTAAP